jgi:alpha-L-fucosidase
MNRTRTSLLLTGCLTVAMPLAFLKAELTSNAVAAASPSPTPALREPETQEQHDARMAWWRKAKFGMFIHWGLYAIPADGEWHMRKHKKPLAEYKKYAADFNPVKFDADEWAAVAHDAGMQYMVITTKHHDGFAMFHSKASDYNIMDATPFRRDPLKELSQACPRHDLKLGTYYSVIADWGHPGGGAGCEKWDDAQKGDLDDYINKVSLPQVRELLSNYGPIAVMWFDSDGAQPKTAEQAARYAPILKMQPNLIIDPRLHGMPGDFETCEAHIPMQPPTGDWELCTRANGCWGYTGAPARTLESLLRELIEAWGKGGNVLLNVGPNREGVIPADSVNVLKQIGAWLKINGESVYDSKRGPFDYLPWGYATRKGDMLYLFVLQWPKDGMLRIPMSTTISKTWLLADSSKVLKTEIKDGVTVVELPQLAPDSIASVIACKVDGEIRPYQSLLIGGKVTASEKSGDAASLASAHGGNWRIPNTSGWVEVDLGKPTTFSVLRLTTPYTKASKILLEAKQGDEWKAIVTEDHPKGNEFVRSFNPVTAQTVRLSITTDKPEEGKKPEIRLGVFELFPAL